MLDQCIRNRMPLPDAIARAPQLQMGLELFYTAFMELSTCRSIGFGEGPIPWTATRDYCDEFALDGDQRLDMFYHIAAMDTVYLQFRARKTAKAAPAKKR